MWPLWPLRGIFERSVPRCVPRGLPCTGIKSNPKEASKFLPRTTQPPPSFLLGVPLVHAISLQLPRTFHASLDLGPSQLPTLLPGNADMGSLDHMPDMAKKRVTAIESYIIQLENAPTPKPLNKGSIHEIWGPRLLWQHLAQCLAYGRCSISVTSCVA